MSVKIIEMPQFLDPVTYLERYREQRKERDQDIGCDMCDGGRIYNNADPTSGQWVDCPRCNPDGAA